MNTDEYRCLQCWRHKHSPYWRIFVAVLRRIFWWLVKHLSHSIIHPVQEWSWLWRKVWFCDGVRVHIIVINDKAVCVLSEQTGWLFTHKSPRSCFHQFIRFPLLRRPFFVSIPFWDYRSPRSWLLLIPRAQRYLTIISGFSRLSDAVEASTLGFLTLHRETKFIIGFDFAVTLSSLASSCVLFDILPTINLTILARISILLLWSGGHRCRE